MPGPRVASGSNGKGGKHAHRMLADFSIASKPGNERAVMALVAEAVRGLGLPPARLKQLETAVAEATMNAMEHGNEYRADAPVAVRVLASAEDLFILITDRGRGAIPAPPSEAPDLEAKLEGLQTPRGWGLFLIRNMVDEMNVTTGGSHHTVELVLHLKGGGDAREAV